MLQSLLQDAFFMAYTSGQSLFLLFQSYVMVVNPGVFALILTECMWKKSWCLSGRSTLQHFPDWCNANKPGTVRCSRYVSTLAHLQSPGHHMMIFIRTHIVHNNYVNDLQQLASSMFFKVTTIPTFSWVSGLNPSHKHGLRIWHYQRTPAKETEYWSKEICCNLNIRINNWSKYTFTT